MSAPRRSFGSRRATRTLLLFGFSFLAIWATARPALASPGDLDLTLAANITGGGDPVHIRSIVVQPDGKILIGGYFRTVDDQPRIGIARLNSDGTLDPSFVPPVFYSSDIYDIYLAPSGDVLIAGKIYPTSSVPDLRQLMWLAPDGTNPQTINLSNTIIDDDSNVVFTVVPEDGGTLLIGGRFFYISDTETPGIARIASNGQVVTPLGKNANLTNWSAGTFVNSIAHQSDGKLVVGGHFLTGNRYSLVRFNTDDTLDGTFNNTGVGTDIQGIVTKVIVEPGDKILVAGAFNYMGGQFSPKLARLDPDGPVDGNHAAIDLFSTGAPSTMERQADGKILLVGNLGPISNVTRNGIARLNSDFSIDSFYPSPGGINGTVESVRTQPDGNILVGGIFTTVAGVSRPKMARLLDTPNHPPQLTSLSVTPAVDENSSVTLTGTVTDADGNALSLSVDWGNGTATYGPYANGANFNVSHQYLDDGPTGTAFDAYQITATISDGNGGSDSDSVSTTVNNLAPTVSSIAATPSSVTVGTTISLTGTVGDTGTLDTHNVSVGWGDGTSSPTNGLAAGVTTFSISHTYTAAGTYSIAVTVSDDDLGQVPVPSAASVTVSQPQLPPSAPTGFNALVTSGRVGKKTTYSAALTWTDSSSDETSFLIQRYVKGKKNACVLDAAFNVTRPANTASYTDGTATASTCGYQIRSQNANGNSAWVRDMNVGSGVTP